MYFIFGKYSAVPAYLQNEKENLKKRSNIKNIITEISVKSKGKSLPVS